MEISGKRLGMGTVAPYILNLCNQFFSGWSAVILLSDNIIKSATTLGLPLSVTDNFRSCPLVPEVDASPYWTEHTWTFIRGLDLSYVKIPPVPWLGTNQGSIGLTR